MCGESFKFIKKPIKFGEVFEFSFTVRLWSRFKVSL